MKTLKKEKVPAFLAYGYTYRSQTCRFGSDALSVKVVTYDGESIVFCVIARGVGQRKMADMASATAIKLYSDWFYEQLNAGDFKFNLFDVDRLKSDWEALHSELHSKTSKHAMRTKEEVGVLSTVVLADTFSHNFNVQDTIGTGIFRIGTVRSMDASGIADATRTTDESGTADVTSPADSSVASIISAPSSWRSVRQWGSSPYMLPNIYHNKSHPHHYDCKSTPKWLSFSLGDKADGIAKKPDDDAYLICTSEIAENISLERITQSFRPEELTSPLAAKIRLERLVKYGGTEKGRADMDNSYDMGSAILIRYCPQVARMR